MTDRVALITGGAKRIGAHLTRTAAEAGYRVVIHYRHSADEAEALAETLRAEGHQAATVQGDLASAEDRAVLISRALKPFGRLDLLVNNASLFDYDSLDTLTEAAMATHHAVNVIAPMILIRDFAAALPEGREGLVVNMLDHKVARPNPDFFSYTASRVGIAGMTGALALALAPRIRVVGIAPGLTLPSTGWADQDFAAGEAATPMKRRTALDDLSAALRFAIEAGSLTGQILTVDGGASLTGRARDLEFETGDSAD